ncbi:MAG: GDP-mannose 4,6-dehydratase [Thermoplasmata archaeon]|nr:GDP-mannose 4,6-dehydratase [Thermoplasmata archaeon]
MEEGATVTSLDMVDRPAIEVSTNDGRYQGVVATISDAEAMRRHLAAADIVIHLAAIADPRACGENPERAWAVNVDGTRNVLEATPDGARFIFLSSAAVYGLPQYLPIDEGHPLIGADPYARTKKAAEGLCAQHASRLHLTVVRNFNTYGPGQGPSFLIPQIVRQAIRDARIEVRSRVPVRDFTYVDDTLEALTRLTLLDGSSPSIINLGTGEGHSVGEIVDMVARDLGALPTTCLEKPVMGSPRLIADTRRANALLDWRPSVGLEDGIRRTLAWYRRHTT